MSSELAQASWTMMELFEMDRYQLQQAAAMVMLSDINTNAQQQCSIKEMASKLATSKQQQRGGRREGRTHHDRARVLASPPRATRATRSTAFAGARAVGVSSNVSNNLT